MSIFDERKIDCHNHLLDPAHFPYAPQAWYQPVSNEQSNAHYMNNLFDSYGVQHALIVGPNSGYDTDNRCLLNFIAQGAGRYKGVAVVDNEISHAELANLKRQGVVGTTMQVALLGVDFFRNTQRLLADLAELDMFADVQVQDDQLLEMAPLLEKSGVRVLIDHCARPDPTAGVQQKGFQLLLELAATDRYFVKISGMVKASKQGYPYEDAFPFVDALLDAFTGDRCMWGSDWPFLRAPERMDYGPMLTLIEQLVPDPEVRGKLLWDTPYRLFGFGTAASG